MGELELLIRQMKYCIISYQRRFWFNTFLLKANFFNLGIFLTFTHIFKPSSEMEFDYKPRIYNEGKAQFLNNAAISLLMKHAAMFSCFKLGRIRLVSV